MAKITLNNNSVEPLGLPNTGLSVELGDSWNTTITNLNTMLTELYGGTSTIAGAKTYSGTQQFNGTVNTQAGTSGSSYGGGGNLSRAVSTIGSSATNTTQTLVSYTLPANALAVTNNGLLITAWGRKAGNAAPVTLALSVGGTTINTGSGTQSGVTWVLNAEVYKSGASAQQELYTAQVGTVFTSPKSTSDTSVDTGTIAITVQALDASAAQSNVLLDGFIVEYFQ